MFHRVNRVELIDHSEHGEGRVYVKWLKGKKVRVISSLQDGGKTLKIFISDDSSDKSVEQPIELAESADVNYGGTN